MLYINSQCDYLSPSININHINVINSPPLTSMAKGHSPLGAAPLAWTLLGASSPVWMSLNFLWIISPLLNKGYHSDVMLKIHRTYSPCDHCSPWNYAFVLFLQISPPRIMGRRMTPPKGMSPPIFSTRWKICYHMTILGPVHALNMCHTIHHETNDMSSMK